MRLTITMAGCSQCYFNFNVLHMLHGRCKHYECKCTCALHTPMPCTQVDEVEVVIDPKDIELTTARSGGAGGKQAII